MSLYITTPLFYVNDLPHIGSAYPTMVSEYLVGYQIQQGKDIAFLTGTDEHGQKIEKAAKANSKTPQEHCDFIADKFKQLWDLLEINYDFFRRTSQLDHREFVTEFFNKVRANGDIYEGEYKGLYCVSCEDFWLEKDLEENENGDLCCPTHKTPVQEYSQKNYFFALSKYEDKLKKYIADNPDFICPEYRKNEVMGWLEEGLKDFPISRLNLDWGIPVPGDNDGQKIYVWFDALLGYISGLGAKRGEYWSEDCEITHIIGKDILRFHAVYWPAMLMSAGYPLPKKVFGHGFLTKDGMKMGKTLGNIIDPVELAQNFGAESLKYYFLREIHFGRDGDFTDEGFIERLNADLANNLGNLLSRSVKLSNKYFDGSISELATAGINEEIDKIFQDLKLKFQAHLEKLSPSFAFEELFVALNKVNALVNDVEPWKVLKQEELSTEDEAKAKSCLYTALEACRQAAIYLAPVTTKLSSKIFRQLGIISEDEATLEALSKEEILTKYFSFAALTKKLSEQKLDPKASPVFMRLKQELSAVS